MAYKFKVGDKAHFKGREGVIITVDKGTKLTYKIKWDNGRTDWFQGKQLDKVVTEFKYPSGQPTFKIGDTVKLTENRAGSCNKVGDVGVIIEIYRDQCRVQVPGRGTVCNWSYKDNLELTTKMTLQEQIIKELGLQVDDVVKITHKVPTGNLGWKGGWISNMDSTIGKEGTVVYINPNKLLVQISF
jgi:hypothetical protein